MDEVKYLGQQVDYLGFLRSQLNGLQGIPTLCYELIQNADDVKDKHGNPGGASRITFDVCEDALVVENDGVFREIDFERMQRLSWGNKRQEDNTTGAFGIGFISVYQITDSPELFSSGRHWVFNPTAPEGKRIAETKVPTEHTRFRLPWQFVPSDVRKELGIPPVEREKLTQYAVQMCRAVRKAALFLKQIWVLEVKRSGSLLCRVETSREGNKILLQEGEKVEVWTLFEGNFSASASALRSEYPGMIEEKRRALVQIAIPDSPDLDGLLYAFLPSETNTQLPFHINADFYPTPDRKRILFDASYRGEWNRAAIECAVEVLSKSIPDIAGLLSPEKFWEFLEKTYQASTQATIDQVFMKFWEPTKQSVRATACVPVLGKTSKKLPPPETILLISENQAKSAAVLSEMGIQVVDPSLKPFQNRLLECGSQKLHISHIVNAFTGMGLNQMGGVPLTRMPKSLQSLEGWRTFWNVLNELPYPLGQVRSQLSGLAIAFGSDGKLWPPSQLKQADKKTQNLFSTIAPETVWFDARGTEGAIPADLVPEFHLDDAIGLLQYHIPQIEELWKEGKYPIKDLYDWLEDQKEGFTSGLKQLFIVFPIWPAADGSLQGLNALSLPGDFHDPLGLSQLINLEALGGKREFLEKTLGVHRLDFINYVSQKVPGVIQSGQLPTRKKIDLLVVMAENLGKMQGDNELKFRLAGLPLVWCGGDRFEKAGICYFESDTLKQVLGDQIVIAQLPEGRREAVRNLYRWLGVAEEPRPQDILGKVKEIIQSRPDAERIQAIERIFEYIASQWERWEVSRKNEFSELKNLAWLPGTGKSMWYRPEEVYSDYRKYLFETQGNFLRFSRPVQQKAAKFFEFLGVKSEPTPQQVVDHVLYCSENGREINKEVYKFLNQHSSDPAITLLKGKACLLLPKSQKLPNGKWIRPQDAFWEEHPFGPYRFKLDSEWREYQSLLEKLGVKNRPDGEDAVDVLLEIAAQFGDAEIVLTGENEQIEAIVFQCWKVLSNELYEGRITAQKIQKKLGSARTIPDNTHLLVSPGQIFLEDRPDWADKFPSIKSNLIKLPQGAWRAMEAAGAQRLSKVVEIDPLEIRDPIESYELEKILRGRIDVINRIIEVHKAGGIQGMDANSLTNLPIFETKGIKVILRVKTFEKSYSQPDSVEAIHKDGRLYFSQSNGHIPWTFIARELAHILYPEEDLPNLALELKEILSSSSVEEANLTLDHMGYPRVQAVNVQPSHQDAAGVGGTEKELEEMGGVSNVEELTRTLRSLSSEGFSSTRHRRQIEIRSKSRLHSYVEWDVSDEHEQNKEDMADEREAISQMGIQIVLEYEQRHGRDAVDLNTEVTNHPGYDIESKDKNGEKRYIEVKAFSGKWESPNPARLTKTEYEKAREKSDKFWLYVVEDIASGNPVIHMIQNPAGKVQYYLFDHGWIDIATKE